jgi:putative ABC transport system permease protein
MVGRNQRKEIAVFGKTANLGALLTGTVDQSRQVLKIPPTPFPLRVAARGLMRSKGFALSGAITLALGIAATTTIFSVVYGVLLRPLPYRDADRLVIIQGEKAYSTGPRILNFSGPELEPFESAANAFSSIAFGARTSLALRDDSGTRSAFGSTVSGRFFETLGTNPLLGRTIANESDPVIVISERLWREAFAAAPDVVGRSVRLIDGPAIERTYTIAGVMPKEFQLPDARTDFWRTLAFARSTGDGRVREMAPGGHEIYARIRDGVTFEAARIDAAAAVERALRPHFTPHRTDIYAKTTRLNEYVRGAMGPVLWVLMGAVSLVLLLACANVANLILARQASRTKEISLRLALGAPRGRLIGFLLCEAAMLAAAGAIVGSAIAVGAIRVLQWLQPAQFTRLDAVAVDLPVLIFATLAAAVATLLAALSPAIVTTRTDAVLALRAGNHGGVAPGIVRWLRSALVIGQIAVSIVLVISASLLARSLAALVNTDLGVNTDKVLAINLDMPSRPGHAVDDARRRQIATDLEARLSALPTVSAVGIGSGVPPSGEYMRVSFTMPEGQAAGSHMVTMVPASPGYFNALQIRLVAGRLFDERDNAVAAPVVIVNREAARRFFGGSNPIGRTLPLMQKEMTIVGVVENVKYTGIAAGPQSTLYQPYAQQPMSISVLFARTTGDPDQIVTDIRRMITTYDSGIGVPRVWSLDAWIADATSQPRVRTILLGSIAIVALCLAMIGLYGVISYSTAQRTAEIALRMAVGARQSDVIRMVLAEGSGLAVIGVTMGLLIASGTTRLVGSFLYGVSAIDTATFFVVAVVLMIIAMAATYLPARRAARIDPMAALRAE